MAIRKDLDDMLNSLKHTGDESLDTEHTEAHRKSIYDDMSVDDLLNALTEEKRPSLAEDILHELDAAETASEAALQQEIQEISPEPELPKKKKVVISGELPDYEELRRQEMEKTMLERRKAEEHLSEMNRLAAEAHEAIRIRNEKYAPEHNVPAAPPVKTELTEELIVNSSSLVSEEETAVFSVPEQPAAPAPQIYEPVNEELAPVTEPFISEVPEPAAEEEAEAENVREKAKKGFFSKLRSRMASAEEEANEIAEETVPEPAEEEIEDEVMIDDLFNESEPEEPVSEPESLPEETDDSYAEEIAEDPSFTEEIPEETSAEALIDAAIAAINQAAQEEENELFSSDIKEEVPEEELSEDISEDIDDSSEDTDRVSSLIDGIREDAANAIAELDKPKEEETQEEKEEAPAVEESSEPAENVPEEAPEKKQGKIASALTNILSEDPDELVAERGEHTEEDDPTEAVSVQKKSFKKRLYAVLGVVFALFAVIGIITVAGKGIKMIRSFTSGEVKKDGFTEVIYPAVIMDIDSFDSPSDLSSEQLITAAIWSIIMDEDKVSKYTPNAGGDTISISAYDVEAEAVELFGEDHQPFEHTTVGRVEPKFFYDSETGAYNVKLKPIIFTYEPEIKSIVKSGDSYTVSVDYLDELPSWMEKTVAKSVEFHLTGRDDGTYRIDSMNINYVNNSH